MTPANHGHLASPLRHDDNRHLPSSCCAGPRPCRCGHRFFLALPPHVVTPTAATDHDQHHETRCHHQDHRRRQFSPSHRSRVPSRPTPDPTHRPRYCPRCKEHKCAFKKMVRHPRPSLSMRPIPARFQPNRRLPLLPSPPQDIWSAPPVLALHFNRFSVEATRCVSAQIQDLKGTTRGVGRGRACCQPKVNIGTEPDVRLQHPELRAQQEPVRNCLLSRHSLPPRHSPPTF